MPLTIEEINTDSNAVIERVTRWFDMIDEILATPLDNEK